MSECIKIATYIYLIRNTHFGVFMDLKLDEGSKILGTFEIKRNGVISGLTSYIGREALIILLPEKKEEYNRLWNIRIQWT